MAIVSLDPQETRIRENSGRFELYIAWLVTSTTPGWVIQHVEREDIVFQINKSKDRLKQQKEKESYWEAWSYSDASQQRVDLVSDSQTNNSVATHRWDDAFTTKRRDIHSDAYGYWKITGSVYFLPVKRFDEKKWKLGKPGDGPGKLRHRKSFNPKNLVCQIQRYESGSWQNLWPREREGKDRWVTPFERSWVYHTEGWKKSPR